MVTTRYRSLDPKNTTVNQKVTLRANYFIWVVTSRTFFMSVDNVFVEHSRDVERSIAESIAEYGEATSAFEDLIFSKEKIKESLEALVEAGWMEFVK